MKYSFREYMQKVTYIQPGKKWVASTYVFFGAAIVVLICMFLMGRALFFPEQVEDVPSTLTGTRIMGGLALLALGFFFVDPLFDDE